MTKTAAVFLGEGCEPTEAVAPVDILTRGGVAVTCVSVMPTLEVRSAYGATLRADALVGDVDLGSFDALVLPGGMGGFENLSVCEALCAELRAATADEKRVVAAICAAPMLLANLGLLEGRTATCYPGCEEGTFPAGAYQRVIGAHHSGNIVTASGPGQAYEFGFAVLEALEGAEAVARVKADMLL